MPSGENTRGRINSFMTERNLCDPPSERNPFLDNKVVPQLLCGGNSLIYIPAFKYVKGFNPILDTAEDWELGYKLREIGHFAYAEKALMSHFYKESVQDLIRRHTIYGYGDRVFEIIHNLPCIRTEELYFINDEFSDLKDIAITSLQKGYDSHDKIKNINKEIYGTRL